MVKSGVEGSWGDCVGVGVGEAFWRGGVEGVEEAVT